MRELPDDLVGRQFPQRAEFATEWTIRGRHHSITAGLCNHGGLTPRRSPDYHQSFSGSWTGLTSPCSGTAGLAGDRSNWATPASAPVPADCRRGLRTYSTVNATAPTNSTMARNASQSNG